MPADSAIAAVDAGTSPWAILGCSEGAPSETIDRAYRQRCLALHPDKTSDPRAPNSFAKVMRAYETLRKTERDASVDELALALFALFQAKQGSRCLRCDEASNPISHSGLCANCTVEATPKCVTCGVVCLSASQCPPCADKTIKGGRCSRMGCLKLAPAGGLCKDCCSRPVKCSTFGCLRKVTPPTTDCDLHRAA